MRVFRTTAAVAVLAAVFAASAAAFGFTDEALLPPDMHLGSPYTFQLSARSGCPPYYYEHQSGSFPPGVSMTSDGLISGTPQIGGTYQTWLAVKNQCPGDSSERLFTFYVVDPSPLEIKTPALGAGVKGAYYKVELRSTEAGVLAWTLNSGQLPLGLTLTKDGAVLGLPTVAGSFSFMAKVNDGRRTASKDFTLTINPAMAFATKPLLEAAVGRRLHQSLEVRGGTRPLIRWEILNGSPPRGVRFASGVFAGKPQVAGTFRITVRVFDANSLSATRTFVLRVRR
jgi:hypothetical protein